jgi:hypothetical protein
MAWSDDIVKLRGPISAHRLSHLTGFTRAKVNAILHADRHFVKHERSPLSHVNARVVWSWSPEKVPLPPARQHINSRNKAQKRKAKKEYEDSLKAAV